MKKFLENNCGETNMSIKHAAEKEGIVVVNKPSGMTSHDVVSCVRRIFKMRRVGHAGTLDPLATGPW